MNEIAQKTPVVAISNFAEPELMDTVCNDEQHGGQLIVDHLVSLGHTRVVHIDGGEAPASPQRRSGFTTAMTARGLAPIVVDGEFNKSAGESAAKLLMQLKEPPTAIVAC